MSADQPIGVGIIGLSATGGWAGRAHVPALAALDGYELRALSATTAESAAAAGRAHGVPLTFGSTAEMVARDEVDLVVVAVKVPHHDELVRLAIDAGKAVLSEWPLGNGLAETETLAGLARKRGVRTAVGLQARSSPVVRYVRDLVADGYVGTVLSTTMVQSGRSWGATVHPASHYVLDAANGATMLTISAGHQLDAVTMVLGELEQVDATLATRRTVVRDQETGEPVPMTAPDQIAVHGRLSSGAVASAHVRGGTSRGLNFHWEINGTDGDLVVASPTGLVQFATVEGGRGDDTSLTPLPVPADYHLVPALAGQEDTVAYAIGHAYHQLRRDWLEGTDDVPTFDDGVVRHRTLDAIERAAATGRRQAVG
ncbi:MAG: Gfo/Idh/MocA family oxidoreductase [Patulibacter sp.]|nr:Gfo/Idh/MocA family oxidoreductase [Patulibacter sp.]